MESHSVAESLIIPQKLKDEKRQEIRDMFKRFDINKDNYLHAYEFQEALEALGFDRSIEAIKLVIDELTEENKLISFADFEQVAMEMVLSRDPVEEMASVFKIMDHDGNGIITFDDLKCITKELDVGDAYSTQELQSFINEFDKNKTGGINKEDFLAVMAEGDT